MSWRDAYSHDGLTVDGRIFFSACCTVSDMNKQSPSKKSLDIQCAFNNFNLSSVTWNWLVCYVYHLTKLFDKPTMKHHLS